MLGQIYNPPRRVEYAKNADKLDNKNSDVFANRNQDEIIEGHWTFNQSGNTQLDITGGPDSGFFTKVFIGSGNGTTGTVNLHLYDVNKHFGGGLRRLSNAGITQIVGYRQGTATSVAEWRDNSAQFNVTAEELQWHGHRIAGLGLTGETWQSLGRVSDYKNSDDYPVAVLVEGASGVTINGNVFAHTHFFILAPGDDSNFNTANTQAWVLR